MPAKTTGTIRANKPYAVFRIVFGVVFLGVGISQYERGGPFVHTAMVSFLIAVLFIGYGVVALVFNRKIGSKFEIDSAGPTERLAELAKL
jgi:hypothetical protein